MEKWFKRLWFVNGILFLIALIGAILVQIIELVPGDSTPQGPLVGDKLDQALSDTLALQDIALTLPRTIGNTSYRFIEVKAKDLTEPAAQRLAKYADYSSPGYYYEKNSLYSGGAINLIFLTSNGSERRLLLNRKALIARADIPAEDDSVQHYNVYYLAFEDTDNNGRLTITDRSDLFISDLNGQNLRQITDGKLMVTEYIKAIPENRIYILAKIRPNDPKTPEEDWPERIFVYDLRMNRLSTLFEDDSLLLKVREMLLSK